MRVSDLKNKILGAVEEESRARGLEPSGDCHYVAASRGVTRLLTVVFLSRRHAEYFGSCSASFFLEAGVSYSDVGAVKSIPERTVLHHYDCHIRHLLRRSRNHTLQMNNLSGPDKKRRDIWWVSRDGTNLSKVADDVSLAMHRQLPDFFERFCNPRRAYRYFSMWWLVRRFPNAPFNIGAPKSPGHLQLLQLLRNQNNLSA